MIFGKSINFSKINILLKKLKEKFKVENTISNIPLIKFIKNLGPVFKKLLI